MLRISTLPLPTAYFSRFHPLSQLLPRPTPISMATPSSNKRNASHLSDPTAGTKKPKANGSISSFFTPKQQGTSNSTPPTLKFNKEKWVASLSPEKKELLQLEIDTLDDSWLSHLKDEIVTNEFLNLKRFLQKEMKSGTTIYPPPEDIYSWYLYPIFPPKYHLTNMVI